MDRYFDQHWFGKIGLVMREFGGPYVGVHVHNPNSLCKLFRMHEDEFETPEVWAKIKRIVDEGAEEPLQGGSCPNCHMPLKNWGRMWQKRRFCGWCGERL